MTDPSLTDWISALSTLVAALFVGWQLLESRRIAQATFEDSLDQQFREIAKDIPVPALLGESVCEADYPHVRELIYNYLDLSNEQSFLFSRGRVGKRTWRSWRQGIEANLKLPVFKRVYDEVQASNPDAFTYLRKM